MDRWGFDEASGVVIGGESYNKYGFFRDGKQVLQPRYFDTDIEAIKWLETEHPEEFKTGVEMRVYS